MLSYSSLSGALAAERERAIREKSRDAWKRRQRGELRLRDAADSDAADLVRLARLDSHARPPVGKLIVAEDRGVLVAAMAVETGETIADPFRATAPIVAMLRLRAEQTRREPPTRSQRTTRLSLRRLRARSAGAG
jgi:hypothetical protein